MSSNLLLQMSKLGTSPFLGEAPLRNDDIGASMSPLISRLPGDLREPFGAAVLPPYLRGIV
jgi:hypothetical protein